METGFKKHQQQFESKYAIVLKYIGKREDLGKSSVKKSDHDTKTPQFNEKHLIIGTNDLNKYQVTLKRLSEYMINKSD
jgi:hypothetical protein